MIDGKKTGAAILCYDTAEHLDKIIFGMHGIVDVIRIFLPQTAFNGAPIKDDVISEAADVCARWSGKHIDIQIVSAVLPEIHKGEREMECDLRNRMLDLLENDGCDYSIVLDCDETYPRKELRYWLYYLIFNDIEVSYCQYSDFYKSEDYEMVSYVLNYVPFFAKSHIRYGWKAPESHPIDLARRFVHNGDAYFIRIPLMRHLTYVRRDLAAKLACWTSRGESTAEDVRQVLEFYENFNGSDKNGFEVKTLGCDGVVTRICKNLAPKVLLKEK